MSTPKLSKYGWIQISLQKPLKLAGFTSNLITFFGFTYFSVGYAVSRGLNMRNKQQGTGKNSNQRRRGLGQPCTTRRTVRGGRFRVDIGGLLP